MIDGSPLDLSLIVPPRKGRDGARGTQIGEMINCGNTGEIVSSVPEASACGSLKRHHQTNPVAISDPWPARNLAPQRDAMKHVSEKMRWKQTPPYQSVQHQRCGGRRSDQEAMIDPARMVICRVAPSRRCHVAR